MERLHFVDQVLGGGITWPLWQCREVLRSYGGYISSAPDELTTVTDLDSKSLTIFVCYCGDPGAFETLTQQELLEALETDGVYSKELKRAAIGTSRMGVIQLSATPFHFNIYHVGPKEYVLVAGSSVSEYDGGAVYRQWKVGKLGD